MTTPDMRVYVHLLKRTYVLCEEEGFKLYKNLKDLRKKKDQLYSSMFLFMSRHSNCSKVTKHKTEFNRPQVHRIVNRMEFPKTREHIHHTRVSCPQQQFFVQCSFIHEPPVTPSTLGYGASHLHLRYGDHKDSNNEESICETNQVQRTTSDVKRTEVILSD